MKALVMQKLGAPPVDAAYHYLEGNPGALPRLVAAHFADHGWPGSLQAAIIGTVFGAVFRWQRELGPVVVLHAAFDLTAVVIIYKGWEAAVPGPQSSRSRDW
jgi:membrane protease YdiL (CAAX protease family)